MKLCKICYYRVNSPKVWCGCTSFFVFYDLFISYTISLLLKMYHYEKKQKQKEIFPFLFSTMNFFYFPHVETATCQKKNLIQKTRTKKIIFISITITCKGQQKAGKVNGTTRKQQEEHFKTNQVNWQQVSNMTEYKKSILERWSFSNGKEEWFFGF